MMATLPRRYLLLSLVLVTVLGSPLTTSAQQGSTGPLSPPSPEVGAPIYAARCANCHGAAGQGDGPQAAEVNLQLPDLTDPSLMRETTPTRWFDMISEGVSGTAMPPFGDASSNPIRQVDRWDLVFYLYTLSTPPTQVAMGQALFERSCVDCHGPDGSAEIGGSSGFADLATMADRSQSELFAAIADSSIEGHNLGLGEVEIWSLTDYVRTFSYNYAAPPEADLLSSAETPTVASPFTGGEGTVTGRVINGTAGATLPEGLEVSLRAFDTNATHIDSVKTLVAADGSFRFEGIDAGVQAQLEPLILYQDIPYYDDRETAIVLSPEQPEANVDITVFENTTDDSAVRIERLHIVFDFAQDRVQVAELYIFSNDGDRTYVGTLEGGTIRLTVPSDALEFQPGGDPSRYLTLADGIADTVPIRPGHSTAESVLLYELAYDDGLELNRPMPYDVSKTTIFLPADLGVELSGERIQAGELFPAQGIDLQTYLAENLNAGERLSMRLAGKPQMSSSATSPAPRESARPSDTMSIAIGAILLAGAVVLAFLYWQGRLVLKRRPLPQDRSPALLQAIADLDDGFETGQLDEEPYRAERARLMEELIGLMQMTGSEPTNPGSDDAAAVAPIADPESPIPDSYD